MCLYLLMSFCTYFRHRIGQCLGLSKASRLQLFPTLAGLIHGLLAVGCPYAATDWFAFLKVATLHPASLARILPPLHLLRIVLAKTIGASICLGFGMIGGNVIPMVVIGACWGHAMSGWLDFLPVSLTVPCCLAACPVSIYPLPLSCTVGVILIVGTNADQTIPIIIATMTAWTMTGGLGILQRSVVAENTRGATNGEDGLEDRSDTGEETGQLLSDDELLNSVRSTIFGG